MIHVEPDGIGFEVDADALSATDAYELDRQAVSAAIDRYLDHRERLYANPPPELDDTTLWLVYALGRSTRAWMEFHVYFLLAKVRALLTEAPQPVETTCELDESIERALADLCDEHEVEFHSSAAERSTADHESTTEHGLSTDQDTRTDDGPSTRPGSATERDQSDHPIRLGSRYDWAGRRLGVLTHHVRSRATESVERGRRWLLFLLFVVVRPLVLRLYASARGSVDVRFWLHPIEPHRERFFGAPADMASRGQQVGYAVYDVVAIRGLTGFLRRGVETVLTAFDPDEPVHVEWYAEPMGLFRALRATPGLSEAIRRTGQAAVNTADSPEYAYLARQVESVSDELVFHLLFIERAIDGFGSRFDDGAWSHPRSPTKLTSRLTALVGDREGIATVAIAPHYFAETRINTRLTDTETEGREAYTLPDVCAVFEPRSATTLRKQRVPSEVVVARDKVESETGRIAHDELPAETAETESEATGRSRQEDPTRSRVSPSDDGHKRMLVIMDLPDENAELVDILSAALRDRTGVELVFKPHPFYPPDGTLFEGLDVDFEVTAPDAALADLVESCDVCVTIYSTAAFPALVEAIPVIWVPFVTSGHIRMDLMTEVGIRADEPGDVAAALERLVDDEAFYAEEAEACAAFAARELVPDGDAPWLADVLETA